MTTWTEARDAEVERMTNALRSFTEEEVAPVGRLLGMLNDSMLAQDTAERFNAGELTIITDALLAVGVDPADRVLTVWRSGDPEGFEEIEESTR